MLKNRTSLMIAFYSFFIVSNAQNQTEQSVFPNTISMNDKILGLSTLWSEIKYNFVNIDQLDFNIDSLYYTYIDSVVYSSDDVHYFDQMQKFISKFNDSHTTVLTPYSWNQYNDYIPLILSKYDDGIYITSLKKDCLDSTFVKAQLIEVENIPVLDWMKTNIYPTISASNERMREYLAVYALHGGVKGSNFIGTFKKTTGAIETVKICRNGEQTRTEDQEYWGVPIKYSMSRVETGWRDDIAILKIRSFQPQVEMIKAIDENLALIQERKCKALIIDLRSNGGGSSLVGFHLQKYLTPIEQNFFLTFGSETRINNAYGKAQGNYRKEYEAFYLNVAYESNLPDTIYIEPDFPRITVPVCVLVNRDCASACEDFLVNIYEVENRPFIIGEETFGSTGAPYLVDLPNKGVARICSIRIKYPYSNKRFLNGGIKPDSYISNSMDDDFNDYDRILESAIQMLNGSD